MPSSRYYAGAHDLRPIYSACDSRTPPVSPVSQVSASAACMVACAAKPVVNNISTKFKAVPAYSLSKYGGSCAHGGLAVEAARTHENQCGCCDPGYLFSGGTCFGARTVCVTFNHIVVGLFSFKK